MILDNPNYDFMLAQAVRQTHAAARILDFGCGTGGLIVKGRRQNLDIWGADTYQSAFEGWSDHLPAEARPFIRQFSEELPFEDASFEVVISNVVFEHIADLGPTLAEIARVLRPGGVLIAMFPVRGTWYEAHCGVYFAHLVPETMDCDAPG